MVAAVGGWAGTTLLPAAANAADPAAGGSSPHQLATFRMRQAAAQAYLDEPQPLHRSNGDEARYADKRASFAKTLPHNDAGEVDAEAFATFVSVLSSGDPNGFETIPRDRNAEVDLNDPQATYAFDLAGLDAAGTSLDPPPAFASAQMATDMAEVYWRSLTRDVPFRNYETDPLVAAAVADMNAFTEPLTSATGEKPTPVTVFRGETRGEVIGPYLSQFLWLDIPYGIKTIEQRYTVPSRGQSFLTDYAEWLACRRGSGALARRRSHPRQRDRQARCQPRWVATPPASTTVPTASAASSSASNRRSGSCATIAAHTTSASTASS